MQLIPFLELSSLLPNDHTQGKLVTVAYGAITVVWSTQLSTLAATPYHKTGR